MKLVHPIVCFLRKNNCLFHYLSGEFSIEILPVQNSTTLDLNRKIANIHDESSAEEAVDSLLNYMATRFEEPEQIQTQSDNHGGNQTVFKSNKEFFKSIIDIKKLAKQELLSRKAGSITTQSDENQVVYKISVDQLAEQLNRENKYLNATAEALAIYRDIFRQSMPDVNPNHNDPDLLPIESSMISWSYLTGDDGSMEEGSLPAIDQTKAEKLISLNDDGTLQTQFFGIDWVIVGVVVFISAALVCGYQNLIAVTEYIDPWTGNKIEDDEQWYMCWIEKRGRSSVKHTETTYLSKKYYTLENLSDAATLASEYLEVNYDPTGYGLALLDSANNNQIGIANNSSFHSQSTDGRIIKFPEDEWLPYLQKGDLIFKKSTRDDIVTKMSFISHVAIFYSKKKEGKPSQVFESMITGVNLYDLGSNWKDDYFYSVRRIANTSASTIAQAVETSVNTWEGSLFRPDIRTPNDGESDPETLKLLTKIDYFREWSDKYNTSGIYCSKLIWLTFKDMKNNFGEYVDLDSNATRAKSNVPRSYLISGNDTGNYGESIWNAYIGVSPDDIFEQKAGAISFALARSKVG